MKIIKGLKFPGREEQICSTIIISYKKNTAGIHEKKIRGY